MKKLRFKGFNDKWQEFELRNIADIKDNLREPVSENAREQLLSTSLDKYPYFGATGVVGFINGYKCDFESVLIGEDGAPFFDKNKDKAFIVSGKYWVNNHAHILIAREKVTNNHFLCHSLNIVDFTEYVTGTTRLKLKKSDLKNIRIKIPSIKEQVKIGELFKSLDESINKTELKISKLKQSKKALLDKLFTTINETYPQLRFKGFSDKWQEFELGNIANIIKGEQVNNSDLSSIGLYPFINGGIEPSGFYDMYNTKAFTITISEGGNSCGYVNFITKNFWSGGHCYTLENLKCNVLFLFSYLKNIEKQIMNLRLGSGLPNIQKKSLFELSLKLPSMQEQVKIGELFKSLDESIGLYEKKLNKLKQIKLALLNKVFKGE